MKIIGLAGWSGAGKTSLVRRVLPILVAKGLRVSTIKHAHHDFNIDQPGKDSWLHREAGATEVLLTSARRFALLHELCGEKEPFLPDLLRRMQDVDLVLIEGSKGEAHPKIEVHRVALGKPLLFLNDTAIVAVASKPLIADAAIPALDLDDSEAIADALLAHAKNPDEIDWDYETRGEGN